MYTYEVQEKLILNNKIMLFYSEPIFCENFFVFEMYFHFFESEIIHFNVFTKRTTAVSFNEFYKIRKFECCTSKNFSF